jgi:hypothetical protein
MSNAAESADSRAEGRGNDVHPLTWGRELSADLYRVMAVVLVVVGHWLAAAVTLRNRLLGNDTVLAICPGRSG